MGSMNNSIVTVLLRPADTSRRQHYRTKRPHTSNSERMQRQRSRILPRFCKLQVV